MSVTRSLGGLRFTHLSYEVGPAASDSNAASALFAYSPVPVNGQRRARERRNVERAFAPWKSGVELSERDGEGWVWLVNWKVG